MDKNLLAVEMAKLSLWLLTMAKDRPFTFLDHAIRPGDSLIGVSAEQLRTFSLDGKGTGISLKNFLDIVPKIMEVTRSQRVRLEKIADDTMSNVEEKERLFNYIQLDTKRLNHAADRLIAASWGPAKPAERAHALRTALEEVEHRIRDVDPNTLEAEGRRALQEAGCPEPFQWAVEFPEVFLDRGGFDAFVGNPPFMGGQKITGNLGNDYRDHLVEHLAGGKRGSADLCAYFFLRVNHLLRPNGQAGLVATNTISQGDTREVGLDQIVDREAWTVDREEVRAAGSKHSPTPHDPRPTIHDPRPTHHAPRTTPHDPRSTPHDPRSTIIRAIPSRKWPGTASLEVAHVWLRKGDWNASFHIDDQPVSGVTPFLTEPGTVSGPPHRLAANAGKSFQGSIVLGMGFVMTPEEAQRLIDKDPRNKDVLFPYLNGQDLNSRPDQSPSRWVINFFDWPLRRVESEEWSVASEERKKTWASAGLVAPDYDGPVAADYPDCLAIVEETVKPERMRNNRKVRRERWWQFAERAPALYQTIDGMERVLVCAQTSRIWEPDFASTGIVYSHTIVVFPIPRYADFASMQWSGHEYWRLEYGPSLRMDARYTPSDCFETFPFPATLHSPLATPDTPSPSTPDASSLATIGETYHNHRQRIMLERGEGLTSTYNRFHDPEESDEAIERLRELHVEMDRAVAAAYGWPDLDLAHGFHETKQGLRFTISDPARREVLARLLKLNHERYAEEVKQGLHDKKRGGGRAKSGGKKAATKRRKAKLSPTLFDDGDN